MAEELIQQVYVEAVFSQGADKTASQVMQIEPAGAFELILAQRHANARHPPGPVDGFCAGRRRKHTIVRATA